MDISNFLYKDIKKIAVGLKNFTEDICNSFTTYKLKSHRNNQSYFEIHSLALCIEAVF